MNFSSQVSGIVAPIVTGYLVSARALVWMGIWRIRDLPVHWDLGLDFLLGIEKIPSQHY